MRKSNFELLRIISMFLIVMSHCDDIFGLTDLYSKSIGINKIITDWLDGGAQIGVGCFVLLSGYFMVEQTVSIKKILKLAGQVWFYTIGIWAIWAVGKLVSGGFDATILKQAVFAFFPILFSHYWFVTAYMILLIMSPFFNRLIFALNKEDYQKFLACLIIIFVVLQGGIPLVFAGMSEGRLIPMFIYYFIAGYLKRFRVERRNNGHRHLIVSLAAYCILMMSYYCITLMGIRLNSDALIGLRYFYRVLNSPFVLVASVELFIAAMETDIKYNKFINEVASCTFGVYLIHQNRIVYEHLHKYFPIYKEPRSLFIFLYSVLAVLLIYSICTIIDYFRKVTVDRLWVFLLDSHIIPFQQSVLRKAKMLFVGVKSGLFRFYS